MLEDRPILVPLDFSADSEQALTHAISLARRFNAPIHLVHCYGTDLFAAVPYDPQFMPLQRDYVEQRSREAARKLAVYRDRVIAEGIAVETHMSEQVPFDAIVHTAREIDAGLIVMGTRGLTGIKHVLLGSVAERVIRNAPCPVLTVKAEARTEAKRAAS